MSDIPLIRLVQVDKAFQSADGNRRPVLQGVDFTLWPGEIVALLGQSGSGKSTLLRIIAGLIPADAGQVLYREQPLYAPARGIGMVFQSFALFPWLTVAQNVALGLEARGVPQAERHRRTQAVLQLIGLAGFDGALPRELSGGMRQRVGIARALVVEPEVLLMDEAFSALDVLTGEHLRDDILALWVSGQMPTRAMLVVSHSIEEAVLMADRVLVLATDPGRVRCELAIELPRPRDPDSLEVRARVDEVYGLMTDSAAPSPRSTSGPRSAEGPGRAERLHIASRLPLADVARLEGLLQTLNTAPFGGRADLPPLAQATALADGVLLPAARALDLLGLAHLVAGDLALSALGRRYVGSRRAVRQDIFGQQVLAHVPLVAHMRHSLEHSPTGQLPQEAFLHLLRAHLSDDEAQRVLRTAIEWARHGEVLEYNYRSGMLHLPDGSDAEVMDAHP